MKTKRISDLSVGEIVAENIYRSKSAETASSQNPIITKGTRVSENLIKKLIKLFGEDFEILVETKKVEVENEIDVKLLEYESEDNEIYSELEREHKADKNITKEKALELYKKSIYKKEKYKKTKERLLSSFDEINGIYKDFQDTQSIDDALVYNVGKKLTNLLINKNDAFDPALIYLVELESWDEVTFNHSFDVAVLALAFASNFSDDPEELTSLFIAGLIHDIGKYFYSKFKLNAMDYIIKKEGKLTDEEYEQVKQHVNVKEFLEEGFQYFDSRYRDNVIYGAIEHHERFRGNGYIQGKKGMEISFAGRVIAICDVYDAMIRERRYKNAMKPSKAMKMMVQFTEQGQFDPILFKKFYKAFGKFPVGSVVSTNIGIGVVVEQTHNHERPLIFFPDKGEVDTSKRKDVEIIEED